MEKHTMTVTVGEEELTFETGKIGRQANGAVVVRAGETIVFSTACAKLEPPETTDFIPLRVDYQEKFSSAGKTLGGFIKREGRPSEREILFSRLIDRPIRPMFEEGYFCDTQVLNYVWSYDGVNTPETLAICGAGAALTISDIPLIKPVAGVRVGLIEEQFILNPTVEHQKQSKLDLLIAGTDDAVLMIEGYCDFLTEEQVLEAIEIGHKGIKIICEALLDWQQKIGKPKNRSALQVLSEDLVDAVDAIVKPLIDPVLHIADKKERELALKEIKEKVHQALCPEGDETEHHPSHVGKVFKKVSAKYMRQMILEEKVRIDGRSTTDVRPIYIEQGPLPRAHGSSLFTRGETQALAVCTLGGKKYGSTF